MQVKEMMTQGFETIDAGESLRRAAELMRDLDVGILPVQHEDALVGTVTDRDITVRAVAQGSDPNATPVAEAMTRGVLFAYEDDDVTKAMETMEANQVRRLLVVDRADKCVGIVSLGDLALTADEEFSGEVLQEVSRSEP